VIDRNARGQFAPGNKVGRTPKRRRRKANTETTRDLIVRADKFLDGIGHPTVGEQLGLILGGLIGKARAGDVQASTWILDRLAPRDSLRLADPLPSPSESPAAYLDAIVERVEDGQLTTADAARLANIARPLLADAEIVQLRDQVAELVATVERLERTRVQVAQ